MRILLKWSTPQAAIPIFDLNISQEEDHFALAKLTVDARLDLPSAGKEGMIEEEGGALLFRGKLIGTPVRVKGNFAELHLVAKPDTFEEQLEDLERRTRVHPYWDPLWIHPDKREDLSEIQDTHLSSLYCDRRTGELSRSNWFEGENLLNLTDYFFEESLKTNLVRFPLKACRVQVHASWIQEDSGVFNLGPSLKCAFPHFKVNTYSKEELLKNWPKAGKRLGRTGISILKSQLKPITPLSFLYPKFSPILNLGEGRSHRLRRYWFKPTLWVRWQAHQRRKEILCFTLRHSFQPFLREEEGEVKEIAFTLHNIYPCPPCFPWRVNTYYSVGSRVIFQGKIYACTSEHLSSFSFEDDQDLWAFLEDHVSALEDPRRASFFLTDRGVLAAEHALERAKKILAQSARTLEVTFEASWEILKDITTHSSVRLLDPRLPGGEVRGKVVKYSLIAKGDTGERYGKVTLLCANGKPEAQAPLARATPVYVNEAYCIESYQGYENSLRISPSGLSYFGYENQSPPTRLQGPILRHVELKHSPDEQEEKLLLCTTPEMVKTLMSEKRTTLKLFFNDFRTKETLEHKVMMEVPSPWSAPRQYVIPLP